VLEQAQVPEQAPELEQVQQAAALRAVAKAAVPRRRLPPSSSHRGSFRAVISV
jgi:hypothetical protein